jgi:hypothetical protein
MGWEGEGQWGDGGKGGKGRREGRVEKRGNRGRKGRKGGKRGWWEGREERNKGMQRVGGGAKGDGGKRMQGRELAQEAYGRRGEGGGAA